MKMFLPSEWTLLLARKKTEICLFQICFSLSLSGVEEISLPRAVTAISIHLPWPRLHITRFEIEKERVLLPGWSLSFSLSLSPFSLKQGRGKKGRRVRTGGRMKEVTALSNYSERIIEKVANHMVSPVERERVFFSMMLVSL